jgi:hypothetical protein
MVLFSLGQITDDIIDRELIIFDHTLALSNNARLRL